MSASQPPRRVLIVDDRPDRARSLADAVEKAGYGRVEAVAQADHAADLARSAETDAVLVRLDVEHGGIEALRAMSDAIERGLPVIGVSSDDSRATRRRAFAAGARDVVHAPEDDLEELVLRLGNALELREIQRGLEAQVRELGEMVDTTALRLDELRRELQLTELEALHRLALAAEYRDDATHEHPQRVARTAALIAREMGLPAEQEWLLRHAAQLHDIGKIGVPDEIMLKPAALDEDEFELMKTHAVIGWQILSGSQARVLSVAAHIALSHHERFDGGGYPNGLAGDAIPLPARITTLADVFDTLTHVRPYREAFRVERAVEEIRRGSRRHFDPRVIGAFEMLDHESLLLPVEPESLEAAPA